MTPGFTADTFTTNVDGNSHDGIHNPTLLPAFLAGYTILSSVQPGSVALRSKNLEVAGSANAVVWLGDWRKVGPRSSVETHSTTASDQPQVVQMTEETQVLLDELAALEKEPTAVVLQRALMAFWTERLFVASRNAVAALRSDSEAWRAYQQEVTLLDGTLADGLGDEPEDV